MTEAGAAGGAFASGDEAALAGADAGGREAYAAGARGLVGRTAPTGRHGDDAEGWRAGVVDKQQRMKKSYRYS